jgi:MoaA/NifB/PqqE/SkfB family radical SAM enzyme
VIESIKLMKRYGIRVVADMVLTHSNCDRPVIDHILKLARELEYQVNFQPVFDHQLVATSMAQISSEIMSIEQMQEAFVHISRCYDPTILYNSHEYITDLAKQGVSQFRTCYMGLYSCVVDPLGNVARCYKYVQQRGNVNGPQIGWGEAVQNVASTDCSTCQYGVHIEDNYTLISRLEETITGDQDHHRQDGSEIIFNPTQVATRSVSRPLSNHPFDRHEYRDEA